MRLNPKGVNSFQAGGASLKELRDLWAFSDKLGRFMTQLIQAKVILCKAIHLSLRSVNFIPSAMGRHLLLSLCVSSKVLGCMELIFQ
jgi:hypothetical protein